MTIKYFIVTAKNVATTKILHEYLSNWQAHMQKLRWGNQVLRMCNQIEIYQVQVQHNTYVGGRT